jgi:hypothetical protein
VFKNGPRLRQTDAGEPFNELVDRRTVFQILKQCRYRYSRATKKPGAAVALSIALNGITGRPINHAESIALEGDLASFQTGLRMGSGVEQSAFIWRKGKGENSAKFIGGR